MRSCRRRRRRLSPAILALLALAVAACTASRGSMLEGEIAQAAQTGGRVELGKLYRAPWERVCVLPAHTPAARVDSLVGFHWRGAGSLTDDGAVGLAFVRGDHLAAFARMRRDRADFASPSAYCLTRAQAVFVSRPHPTVAGSRLIEPMQNR